LPSLDKIEASPSGAGSIDPRPRWPCRCPTVVHAGARGDRAGARGDRAGARV